VTLRNMQMCHVPFLVTRKPSKVDDHIWDIIKQNTKMDLGLFYTFDTSLSKIAFSNCCNLTVQVSEVITKMTGTKLVITPWVRAQVVKFGYYQILIQHLINDEKQWPYPSADLKGNKSGLLLLIRSTMEVSIDSLWIILHVLASKLQKELENLNGDYHLVCPEMVMKKDCHHGELFLNVLNPLEKVENEPRLMKKLTCKNCPHNSAYFRTCYPSQVAIDILECLESKADDSPFNVPPSPDENCLDINNILTLICTQDVVDLRIKLKSHPALLSTTDKFVFIIRQVRQHFDELELDTQKAGKHYIENFTSIEENSSIVTNGDWKTILQPIMDKYGTDDKKIVSGKRSSVTALVREFRNACAHLHTTKDFDQFFKEVEKSFKWLIMRCFIHIHLMIPEQDPSLKEFAMIFKKFEASTYEKRLEDGTLSAPKDPLLHVTARYSDDAKPPKESILYCDSDLMPDDLKKELFLKFDIPTNEQKVEYLGISELGVEPTLDDAVELESLSLANLDTKFLHLIHITQCPIDMGREVKVEVTLILEEEEQKINLTTFSKQTISDISLSIQNETGIKHELLFIHGESVDVCKDVCIETLCNGDEDICNLTAQKRIKIDEPKEDVFACDEEGGLLGAFF
jgi:hypothetical protein